ncbi:MAG: 50S ribosomal protein L30 [Candidatus Sericytochromatia bacterium]|nr:50S ribosomal protein L30 [Candidatus Sericytochromatia bacterium]
MPETKKISVKLVRSRIGYCYKQHRVLQSLGLGKTNSTVSHFDTPIIRGMVNKVRHLVTVSEEN